jgi:ribokinase
MEPAIAVVGSLNLDLVVRVARHPRPGETVLGGDVQRYPGGKGANQAVAAARLGQPVAMIGRVGEDDAGWMLRAVLDDDGVDTSRVLETAGVPSGTALITVDDAGENAIVVSPGANARVTPEDVREAEEVLAAASATLLQLEIPVDAVAEAARAAHGTVVLNPAPATTLPRDVLAAAGVIVPNRSELALLAGRDVVTADDAEAAASALGVRNVVVTLGGEGALVVQGGRATSVPAVPVRAVDTTGAGDSFCAALADALVRGAELVEAARWAVRVAAVTVTRPGAQTSLPRRDDIPDDATARRPA